MFASDIGGGFPFKVGTNLTIFYFGGISLSLVQYSKLTRV